MNKKVLKEALDNNLNVLLEGSHGTGKTMTVKELFTEKYGPLHENWLYFSAATMDPWVDFIGVPKEKTNEAGESYLELIKPKYFLGDKIEAIFFDELNRSHKKVRNAIMEILQFKSINGVPLPNLKVIWAAINPDDEEDSYDVEKLDPAQLDRFEIHMKVPNSPNLKYFKTNYGSQGVNAVKWWNKLSNNQKKLVSPRRLEYAVKGIKNNYSITNILYSNQINLTEFLSYVKDGDPIETLKDLVSSSDSEKSQFFSDHNNIKAVMKFINSSDEFSNTFCPHIPTEELLKYLGKKNLKSIAKEVMNNIQNYPEIAQTLHDSPKNYTSKVVQAATNFIRSKNLSNTFPDGKVTLGGNVYNLSTLYIAVTGSDPKYTRRDIEKALTNMGITYKTSMSSGVTILAVGTGGEKTSKYFFAQRNYIPVVGLSEIISLIESGTNNSVKSNPILINNISAKDMLGRL